MSDTPRIYRSTDPGAPVLSGQAGAYVALLDAVLVDGYGSGGDAKVPLGWTRAFTGTNKRAFRNDPVDYTGCYMRFDDSNAQYVLVDGYEAMSSVDSGSERFSSTSNAWPKSSAASSAARPWIVVGTARCVYVSVQTTGSGTWSTHFFGDTHPILDTDTLTFMYSKASTANSYNTNSSLGNMISGLSFSAQRTISGVSGAAECRANQSLFGNSSSWGGGGFAYPFHGTAGPLISRGFLGEGAVNNGPSRVWMPGLWVPDHGMSSIYDGGEVVTDVLSGASLLVIIACGNSPVTRMYLDLTNDWVAN